jgi:uncharacterized protein HemX
MPILLAAWGLLKKIPPLYLALALLAAALWLDHTRLKWCLEEKTTIQTELRQAAGANQADVATIAAQREALARLSASLDQERAAAAAAADTASRRDQELQRQLAADQKKLNDLRSDPRYAPFLSIDLDSQYPALARGLRDADAGQD